MDSHIVDPLTDMRSSFKKLQVMGYRSAATTLFPCWKLVHCLMPRAVRERILARVKSLIFCNLLLNICNMG